MEALIKEFRMLKESDYWHYLTTTTKDGISAMLDKDQRKENDMPRKEQMTPGLENM